MLPKQPSNSCVTSSLFLHALTTLIPAEVFYVPFLERTCLELEHGSAAAVTAVRVSGCPQPFSETMDR